MIHPCDATLARTVHTLRAGLAPKAEDGALRYGESAGIYWDASGGTAVSPVAAPGALIAIEARVPARPGWFSLGLFAGSGSFAAGDTLVIAAAIEGAADAALPVQIRSTRDGKSTETTLDEPLKGSAGRTVRTVLHTVEDGSGLTGAPAGQSLLIGLPSQDFTLTLWDLRLAVVPAAAGVSARPAVLAAG